MISLRKTLLWFLVVCSCIALVSVVQRPANASASTMTGPIAANRAKKSSFSPSDIAGLKLWLKADGNVYNTGTTQATDGQTVATWVDASGNGNNATQSTNKPTFKTGIVNSLPVIRFNGTSNIMQTAGASYAIQTVIAVFNRSSTTDFEGIITTRPSGLSDKVPASDAPYGFGGGGGGSAKSSLVATKSSSSGSGTEFSTVTDNGTSGSITNFQSYDIGLASSLNSWRIVCAIKTNVSAAGAKYWCIGADAYGASGRFLAGDIAEIIIYDSALGSTDQTSIKNYLSTKYNITVAADFHKRTEREGLYTIILRIRIDADRWKPEQLQLAA